MYELTFKFLENIFPEFEILKIILIFHFYDFYRKMVTILNFLESLLFKYFLFFILMN